MILSLAENETWKLINKPKGKRVIGYKWVFERKLGIPVVEKERFKARLIAKGDSQVEGIDYLKFFPLW